MPNVTQSFCLGLFRDLVVWVWEHFYDCLLFWTGAIRPGADLIAPVLARIIQLMRLYVLTPFDLTEPS